MTLGRKTRCFAPASQITSSKTFRSTSSGCGADVSRAVQSQGIVLRQKTRKVHGCLSSHLAPLNAFAKNQDRTAEPVLQFSTVPSSPFPFSLPRSRLLMSPPSPPPFSPSPFSSPLLEERGIVKEQQCTRLHRISDRTYLLWFQKTLTFVSNRAPVSNQCLCQYRL